MSKYIDFDDELGDGEDLDELGAALNTDPDTLSNNALAFIALCNEYCAAIENAAMNEPSALINSMLRMLPRLYISAMDIKTDMLNGEGGYIAPALEEDVYDQLRQTLAGVIGEDDTYLEVFEEDMKYSDTPIAATISESLADLFQVFYDFLETVRDAPNELINEALTSVKESFASYWSQTLTNVLRAINAVKFN